MESGTKGYATANVTISQDILSQIARLFDGSRGMLLARIDNYFKAIVKLDPELGEYIGKTYAAAEDRLTLITTKYTKEYRISREKALTGNKIIDCLEIIRENVII